MKKTKMAVLKFSVLRELSVWTYQLLVLVQCVALVLQDSLEMD